VIRQRPHRQGLQVQVYAGRDPLSPTTVMSYRGDLDRYVLPALGRLRLHQLDAATLDRLYARLRAEGGRAAAPETTRTPHLRALTAVPPTAWTAAGSPPSSAPSICRG